MTVPKGTAVLARLGPAVAGTIETCGMIVRGSEGSYHFDAKSTRFNVYAVVKLVALLVLPAIEDAAFCTCPRVCRKVFPRYTVLS